MTFGLVRIFTFRNSEFPLWNFLWLYLYIRLIIIKSGEILRFTRLSALLQFFSQGDLGEWNSQECGRWQKPTEFFSHPRLGTFSSSRGTDLHSSIRSHLPHADHGAKLQNLASAFSWSTDLQSLSWQDSSHWQQSARSCGTTAEMGGLQRTSFVSWSCYGMFRFRKKIVSSLFCFHPVNAKPEKKHSRDSKKTFPLGFIKSSGFASLVPVIPN